MKDDPIVEETRRLRDGYCARHGYDIHAIAEDLRQWEYQGFPMAENVRKTFIPTLAPRQDEGDDR